MKFQSDFKQRGFVKITADHGVQIVQFRINQNRWIKGLKTHLYTVSLDPKKNVQNY